MIASKNPRASGFTIVELLIVIVVIAILAAITIVAFNGVQNRALDSTVASDLSSAGKRIQMAKVDLGHYPQVLSEIPSLALSKGAWDQEANNAYFCHNTDTGEYALGARSKSKKAYVLSSISGITERTGISAAATCQHVGKNWGDPGTYNTTGFTSSNSVWAAWTN